jgi:hypothetical protein
VTVAPGERVAAMLVGALRSAVGVATTVAGAVQDASNAARSKRTIARR